MLSLNDIKDFAANSIYGLKTPKFNDRWRFKVSMPDWDANKIFKEIVDSQYSQYVNQNGIVSEYSPGRFDITFEVTSPGYSERIKQYIIKHGWHYTIDYIPDPLIADNNNINGVNTYFIKEEDIKMPKVKTQAPTHYPAYKKFSKVIKSGPVTVAWIEGKKFMVRKTKKDKDDPEKAMLMLFAKSQFGSEAAFHRWFRDQMGMFKEAEDNAKNRS